MTLGELYRKAVTVGMTRDLRGAESVAADLARAQKDRDLLPEEDRHFFDPERANNPYADTRILHGDPDLELSGILVGIDADVGEMLLADRLRERGARLDAVVAHHPRGHALAQLSDVMFMQPVIHSLLGVPIGQAEGVLTPRTKEVADRLQPVNHQQAVDAARLLEIPFICLHTVADNCVAHHLTELFARESPERLDDVLALLHRIPEYQTARREQTGPTLVLGDKKNRTGKIFVDMTGGTEGAKEMYQKFAQSTEVSTIVGMHLSKEHVEEAKKHHLNVILAGHISSDNLGVNLLLDEILDPAVEVLEMGGFRRVRRNDR